jgi:hypothetical protein
VAISSDSQYIRGPSSPQEPGSQTLGAEGDEAAALYNEVLLQSLNGGTDVETRGCMLLGFYAWNCGSVILTESDFLVHFGMKESFQN